MASYAGQVPTDQPFATAREPSRATSALLGGVVTYYYRTIADARGWTTDPSAIPVGAVLERES